MNKIFKLLLVIFVVLGAVSAYFLLTQEKYIDKKTAIEQAQLSCMEVHSQPQEEPYNIEAKLIKCADVVAQTGWNGCSIDGYHSSDSMVWFVSMDGLWFHWGPPAEDGTNAPIAMTKCQVLIDAKSGHMFALRS
ncbi:MAG: hypothetical protein IH588_04465 [Anaerolineales bacterium]|nr:hypothetical protein [Anaerolineales bacterium]